MMDDGTAPQRYSTKSRWWGGGTVSVTPKFGVVSFRESPSVKGWVVGCGLVLVFWYFDILLTKFGSVLIGTNFSWLLMSRRKTEKIPTDFICSPLNRLYSNAKCCWQSRTYAVAVRGVYSRSNWWRYSTYIEKLNFGEWKEIKKAVKLESDVKFQEMVERSCRNRDILPMNRVFRFQPRARVYGRLNGAISARLYSKASSFVDLECMRTNQRSHRNILWMDWSWASFRMANGRHK